MARYQHANRYGRSALFKQRFTQRPTKKLNRYIANEVSKITSMSVRYPRTDPPNFKRTRAFKRLIRLPINETQTEFNMNQVAVEEASYYGKTGTGAENGRWRFMKCLAYTFYGLETVDGIQVNITGDGYAGNTSFSDVGDRNHRACIKVIMPPTTSVHPTDNTSPRATFPAGTLDFIDIYVEMS